MSKQEFLEKELKQYGISINDQEFLRDLLLPKLDIMSKKAITNAIEEAIDLYHMA